MPTRGQDRDGHERRRRGLRVLLWAGAFFLLAQVGGGLLLDYAWLRARWPFQANVYAHLKARQRTPEVFFFGSSRFEAGINCGVLDAALRRALGEGAPRTFNAALPAGDGTVFERVFDDIRQQGRLPRLVVLEISPETVARRDNWLYQHALTLLDWRDVPEAALALCRNGRILYLLRGRLLPLQIHHYHIVRETLALLAAPFTRGEPAEAGDPPVPEAVPDDPPPPDLGPEARTRQEEGYGVCAQEVRNYAVGGLTAQRLERLLERCRSLEIPVVLVGAPVASGYRRAYTPAVDAVYRAYMDTLCRRFGCRFTDWRDRVPDDYFVDARHLCQAGSVYLSRRLAQEVVIPAWREGTSRRGLLARR